DRPGGDIQAHVVDEVDRILLRRIERAGQYAHRRDCRRSCRQGTHQRNRSDPCRQAHLSAGSSRLAVHRPNTDLAECGRSHGLSSVRLKVPAAIGPVLVSRTRTNGECDNKNPLSTRFAGEYWKGAGTKTGGARRDATRAFVVSLMPEGGSQDT